MLDSRMFFGDPSLSRLPLTLSPHSSRPAQSFSVSLVRRISRRPLDTPAHSRSLELPSPAPFRLLTFNFRPLITVPFSNRRKINTSAKFPSNSRRINTSNFIELKPTQNEQLRKEGRVMPAIPIRRRVASTSRSWTWSRISCKPRRGETT